jgi:hypothetical protein
MPNWRNIILRILLDLIIAAKVFLYAYKKDNRLQEPHTNSGRAIECAFHSRQALQFHNLYSRLE